MTPREFEEAICALFGKMGYRLTVTGKSHDGGIDLDGVNMGLGGVRIVVQCKRYKGAVPISMVRDLVGVVYGDNSIERGFLVTTGKFSHAAWSFARDKRVTLIEGYELEVRFASTMPAYQVSTPR